MPSDAMRRYKGAKREAEVAGLITLSAIDRAVYLHDPVEADDMIDEAVRRAVYAYRAYRAYQQALHEVA